MVLSIHQIAKAYGDTTVLKDISFGVPAGQKIGLVGANGVGKSTLLKIIIGELKPDRGRVRLAEGAEIGYLAQTLSDVGSMTVSDLIDTMLGQIRQIEERMRELEGVMAAADVDLDPILAEYGEISERFERRGGYELDYRLDQVFAGLGISRIDRTRPVHTLSGGEKSRVGMAALLLQAPDLLLLDEPTNHLDFAAMDWLEGYLKRYSGSILLVSHNRHFLNTMVSQIVEIQEHNREAKVYTGNYDFYAAVKAQEREKWTASYWAQQVEIRELRRQMKVKSNVKLPTHRPPGESDKLGFNAKIATRESTLSKEIRSAEEKLRRILDDPIPKPPSEIKINSDFDPRSLSNKTPITLSDVSHAYEERQILDHVTSTVEASSRIVIFGQNGAGKSTLLKIMAGELKPETGAVHIAPSVTLGHLDQEQETLITDGTLLDVYQDGRIGHDKELINELLSYGLFNYSDLATHASKLSIGQKRKLQISYLISRQANVLLLDEPTNHISLDVLEDFERALLEFPGPIVAISHDRRFIERFANEIWEIQDGRLIRFPGTWAEYRANPPVIESLIED